MKKFICKSGLFAIVMIFIICMGELIIQNMIADNSYSYKNKFVLENNEDIKTLILGNSHLFFGLNPEHFKQGTFNFANVGQPAEIDSQLLTGYNFNNLEVVIIPVSFFTMRGAGFKNPKNAWQYLNYKIYMDAKIDCDFKYNFAISESTYYRKKLASNFSTGAKWATFTYPCDSLGWHYRNYRNKSNTWDKITIGDMNDTSIIKANINYFTNIMDFCKDKSIRLIIVSTPLWHTYYENMNPILCSEMLDIVKELQEQYSCVEYYNFIDDKRFVEEDFFDSHHLSGEGGDKFSRILADTLKL